MLPSFNKNERDSNSDSINAQNVARHIDQDSQSIHTHGSFAPGENKTNDASNEEPIHLNDMNLQPTENQTNNATQELSPDLEQNMAPEHHEMEDHEFYPEHEEDPQRHAEMLEHLDDMGVVPNYAGIGFGMVPSFLDNNSEIQKYREDIRNDLEDGEDSHRFDIDFTDSATLNSDSDEDQDHDDNYVEGYYPEQEEHGSNAPRRNSSIRSTRSNRSTHSNRSTQSNRSNRSNRSSRSQKRGKVDHRSPLRRLGILGSLLRLHQATPVTRSNTHVRRNDKNRKSSSYSSSSTDNDAEANQELLEKSKKKTDEEEENEDKFDTDQATMTNTRTNTNTINQSTPQGKPPLVSKSSSKFNGMKNSNMYVKGKNVLPSSMKTAKAAGQGVYSAGQGVYNTGKENMPNFKSVRPKLNNASKLNKLIKKRKAHEAKITVHITNLLQKHRFIIRLCKAFMLYGAPTHRLEEYMKLTSKVLECDGQFLYLPGCMVISFGDVTTRTSELQMVKCDQGLNFWKLHQTHKIYKDVIHDIISVEEANNDLDDIMASPDLYGTYITVPLYALASGIITPMAFGGSWVNIAISFVVGGCVGLLKFILSPKSQLYSNVFEITSSIVVSFLSRALGSIPHSNICFGTVVQGSLALILPGYIILCGSLELQNKNLVAGSVRMFYSIIYSLFLSFGITLGAALWGWMYHNATNETTCTKNVSDYNKIWFVPAYTIITSFINQANWTQIPVMTVIACTGYIVTYYSGKHFSNATEFTSAMAAFVIGILGNLYSRIWKGLAVSAILPAIFVQVPSGIASKSSLLTGVNTANTIVNQSGTVVTETSTNSLSFGLTMVQVSIGITVGLFASTLVIYPFGKKKTAIFSL